MIIFHLPGLALDLFGICDDTEIVSAPTFEEFQYGDKIETEGYAEVRETISVYFKHGL